MMKYGELVVVAGSRGWKGPECERIMRRELSQFDPSRTVLMHGDCEGADRMARDLVEEFGWLAVIPVPYFSRILDLELGRRGGPARNQVMALIGARSRSSVDVTVAAFPLPKSKGTWDCVRQFKNIAHRIIVVRDLLPE